MERPTIRMRFPIALVTVQLLASVVTSGADVNYTDNGHVEVMRQDDPHHNWTFSWLYHSLPPETRYYVIKSPGFPDECCQPMSYTAFESNDNMEVVCIDQDFPDGTGFRFWTGPETHTGDIIWQGAIARRVNWITKGYLRVEFRPPAGNYNGIHTGFKCLVWMTPNDVSSFEWAPRPYTTCDRIHSVLKGGKIHIGIDSTWEYEFFFDCLWQFRVPVSSVEDWRVYVRVVEMDVDGLVEIREGLHSEGPLLAANVRDFPERRSLSSLGQPPGGFHSNKGLYMRVIKDHYRGNITVVYGAFVKTDVDGYECEFRHENKSTSQGFMCRAQGWCIPLENTCDGVPNCEDGSDEMYYCTSDSELPHQPLDPRSCQHDDALLLCPNSGCVQSGMTCPTHYCPNDKPNRCHDNRTCIVTSQRCDGTAHCPDDSDEMNCPGMSSVVIYVLVTVFSFLLIAAVVLLVYFICRRKSQSREHSEPPTLGMTRLTSPDAVE